MIDTWSLITIEICIINYYIFNGKNCSFVNMTMWMKGYRIHVHFYWIFFSYNYKSRLKFSFINSSSFLFAEMSSLNVCILCEWHFAYLFSQFKFWFRYLLEGKLIIRSRYFIKFPKICLFSKITVKHWSNNKTGKLTWKYKKKANQFKF